MTEEQILNYLDKCDFPMLDNGYYYHADQELRIFRKDKNWLIILQVLQFNNHCLLIKGVTTIVYKYGTSIEPESSFSNDSFHNLAEDYEVPSFIEEDETFNSYLNPLAKYIRLRNKKIKIEHDTTKYVRKGIDLETEDKIRPWEFLRYLTPEFSNHFWLTNEELKIDQDLEEAIRIKTWEHPDNIETVFSDMNSFKEISKCLALNIEFDRTKIETKNSNTHWSNWPNGGTL